MNKTEKVGQFHTLFEQPIGKINELESLSVRQLRIKLLFEELHELAEAGDVELTFHNLCEGQLVKNLKKYGPDTGKFGDISLQPLHDGDDVNKKEELDALCDIEYVLHGKINTSGLQEVFDAAFDLVHNNNMKKAHKDVHHANETVKIKNLEGFNIKQKSETEILLYNKDNKLIKPHDHEKVDLSIFFIKGI